MTTGPDEGPDSCPEVVCVKLTGFWALVWYRPFDQPVRRQVWADDGKWYVRKRSNGGFIPIDSASGWVIDDGRSDARL